MKANNHQLRYKRAGVIFWLVLGLTIGTGCGQADSHLPPVPTRPPFDYSTAHLDYLYTPIVFKTGQQAAGIYIYAEAPNYTLTGDSDEGYTCVDDVARAAQVYLRHKDFETDTSIQNKTVNLLHFLLQMQSNNGYFYNFLFPDGSINTTGNTSINRADWWSWRAFQTLTEAAPKIKSLNPSIHLEMEKAIKKLANNIKSDLALLPLQSKNVLGLKVPEWLPAGSATDQSAILILGLINYVSAYDDVALKNYIRKLAVGIMQMQTGDATHFPYFAIMSWENVWHAYGCDQAYALLKAGQFLNETTIIKSALREVDHFYPWLLNEGLLSNFTIRRENDSTILVDKKEFEQIAYGIRPMIAATAEAYFLTKDPKYSDMAGIFGAWFFGRNKPGIPMFDSATGRGFDGILNAEKINKNSGAESTIECLLSLQILESDTSFLAALNKYRFGKKRSNAIK